MSLSLLIVIGEWIITIGMFYCMRKMNKEERLMFFAASLMMPLMMPLIAIVTTVLYFIDLNWRH